MPFRVSYADGDYETLTVGEKLPKIGGKGAKSPAAV